MADFTAAYLVALLMRGIDGSAPTSAVWSRAFADIQAVIEAEIDNPDLSAKLVCAHIGLSRTVLFEAVAAEGHTLREMILGRRFAGCIGDMMRTGGNEPLATISGRWGFRDQSTFNRAFRRRFGETPTRWLRDNAD